MNNDNTRPADTSGHTAQSEQSEAAVATSQNESDISMADLKAMYKDIAERFQETSEQIKETDALVKATSEQIKETDALVNATSEQMKRTDERLKEMYTELNTNWSRLLESMVRGKLVELLRSRKIDVTRTYPNVKTHYMDDDGKRREREFDIVVRNGTEVVVFEVKTTLRPENVEWFVSVMRNISRYFPEYATKRTYGGVAYVREESDAGRQAAEQGLYVIRATGDSASIVNDAEFKPVSFTKATSAPVGGHLRAVPDC